MSGDYSRYDFDPSRDFQGVLLQQGRPLTDADWNEWVAQCQRFAQATALDTLGGGAVVPTTTPDAFALAWSGSNLTIGRGRIYVDGLLVENHGVSQLAWDDGWDPALAEAYGSQATPYGQQPYLPNPPSLPKSGRHLVYVDVWRRDVNQYEAPDIVEKAIGVDTTTRLQNAWQVKVLELDNGAGNTLTCNSDPSSIPGWNDLIAPSAGRVSTHTAQYGTSDPCIIPPTGGYTGLENQLYRVEIHDGGAPGTATFKWSRDNASVEARVLSIGSSTRFVVDSLGKDQFLGFSPGDWIELTDNWLEFAQQPGLMLKIKAGGVDAATGTITVETAIDATKFPAGTPDPSRCTRIRRWDQQGKVLRTDTNPPSVYADLDSGTGVIPVPTDNTTTIALENGITVTFDVATTGGKFRSGDYWTFAARTVDASIESLKEAPPRGVFHHYAILGYIQPPASADNCRHYWPPTTSGGCACTVCVSPQAHAQSSPSLQQAIDAVIKQGGGTVCLEAGDYALKDPLVIRGAMELILRGQREATHITAATGMAIAVIDCIDVALEDCAVKTNSASGKNLLGCIVLDGAQRVRVAGMTVVDTQDAQPGTANNSFAAVACLKRPVELTCTGNMSLADTGIAIEQLGYGSTNTAATNNTSRYLVYVNVGAASIGMMVVEDNLFGCRSSAVSMQLSGGGTSRFRIERNQMIGCTNPAIRITGATEGFASFDIAANTIEHCGLGVAIGNSSVADVIVRDNRIEQTGNANGEAQCIQVTGVQSFALTGNRIDKVAQAIEQPTLTAVLVQQCTTVRIAGNVLTGIGPLKPTGGQVTAIRITEASDTVSIHGNAISQSVQATAITDLIWNGIVLDGPAATGSTWTFQAVPPNLVEIHSNQFVAYANTVVATIQAANTCHFCNNQFRLPSTVKDARAGRDNVKITAHWLIVSNNSIDGAFTLTTTPGSNQPAAATVTGNITTGPIALNGAALPVPWAPLNLQV